MPLFAGDDDALTKRQAKKEAPPATKTPAAKGDFAIYDHEKHQMNCAGRTTGGPCRLTVDEGALVSLQVIHSIPGVLAVQIQKIDKTPDGLSQADFAKLTAGIAGGKPTAANVTPESFESSQCSASICNSALSCYNEIQARIDALQGSIDNDLTEYGRAICDFTETTKAFKSKIGNPGDDAEKVQEAFFAKLAVAGQAGAAGAADTVKTFYGKVEQIRRNAPANLADFPAPYEVEYSDRDFDLVLTFTTINDLLTPPTDSRRVQVRLRNGWGVSTSTALMASGLSDDTFTTSAYTATVNGASVEKHRAIREERDIASPEIAFLVNLVPKAPSMLGRSVLSVGLGLGQNNGGRLYGTWGYRFGQAGAFHFGFALGKVKRLSKNVDVEDLGDVDPNASRRDVMRPSFTIGISWRLTD
ncbi:MAG: hypothetical protein ABI779_22675 [Acidobacteriota bacterium]